MEECSQPRKFYKYLDDYYEPTEEEFCEFIYTVFKCCICRYICTAPCWRASDGDVICKPCQKRHYSNEKVYPDGSLLLPKFHSLCRCKFKCCFTGTEEEVTDHENKCPFKAILEEYTSLRIQKLQNKAAREEIQSTPEREENIKNYRVDENNNKCED